MIGFGSKGIRANSCASWCHSGIGDVISGSVFSIFTSLGMLHVFNVGMICGVVLILGGWLDFETMWNENKGFLDSVVNNTLSTFNKTNSGINENGENQINKL